jgi:hypothetical protein
VRLLGGLTLAALLLWLTLSSAQAGEPQVVSVELRNAEGLTVGDRFELHLAIAHDPGTEAVFPSQAQAGDIDVISVSQPSTREEGGRLVSEVTYELAAFNLGPLLVGPIAVDLVGPDGATIQQLIVDPQPIEVLSTVGANQSVLQLRDIEGQYVPPETASSQVQPYIIAAVAIVAAIALSFAAWVAWRRLRRPQEGPAGLTPEEQAEVDLEALAASGLLAGRTSENYARLSRAVRTYLAARYGFPALSSSTREIEREMLARGLDRWQARLVSGLLSECDEVVFAGYQPAPERAESDITLAYQIVEMTEQPERIPAPAPAGGG